MLHYTKVERFARDKHSRLLGTFVSCEESKVLQILSTGDLRILPDLSTFYGRKVGKFTAVKRPIYGDLFTGSRYKKRRKLRSVAVKICKTQ